MTGSDLKFMCDEGLFDLCKLLRMLGYDTLDRRALSQSEAVRRAIEERRVWIARDLGDPSLQYGIRYYLLQTEEVNDQIGEIDREYRIFTLAVPFRRCLRCNELLVEAEAEDVEQEVPLEAREHYQEFRRCPECRRIYWPGSHWERMLARLAEIGWNPK